VILVGAQAVYLRAPLNVAFMPLYTFDGDLVVDPDKIGRPRRIREHLEAAGFELRGRFGGFYSLREAGADEQYASQVDILVPGGVAHRWTQDGFNARDASATFEQPGLEICLLDHSQMRIELVDDDNAEAIDVEVAGVLALLVAKGWKIGERFDQGPEAFRQVDKDVADVYRLLRASTTPDDVRTTLSKLPYPQAAPVVRTGNERLQQLCGKRGDGTALFRDLLGPGDEAALMVASLSELVEEFCDIVSAWLGQEEKAETRHDVSPLPSRTE
jgi:hypothetical protein